MPVYEESVVELSCRSTIFSSSVKCPQVRYYLNKICHLCIDGKLSGFVCSLESIIHYGMTWITIAGIQWVHWMLISGHTTWCIHFAIDQICMQFGFGRILFLLINALGILHFTIPKNNINFVGQNLGTEWHIFVI